jgi:murein DD-endopeptidase MepM/ murein hydrolase activator NlpD
MRRRNLLILLSIILLGYLLPQPRVIPVQGADHSSWNPASFWYYPWGKSGVHKGIDIFAKEGTPVLSSSYGIVIYQGTLNLGGNVVLVLGPKWRLHYYAHLKKANVHFFSLLSTSEQLGEVGTTGNAAGKPPHLHYSLITVIPFPWRIDSTIQGWKKMFYLDPAAEL